MCKREDYLRGERVASVFYRHDCTLCDRLSALPYRLSDGCIATKVHSNGLVTEKKGQFEGRDTFEVAGVAEGIGKI